MDKKTSLKKGMQRVSRGVTRRHKFRVERTMPAYMRNRWKFIQTNHQPNR